MFVCPILSLVIAVWSFLISKSGVFSNVNSLILYLGVNIKKLDFSKVIFLTYCDTEKYRAVEKMIFFHGKEGLAVKGLISFSFACGLRISQFSMEHIRTISFYGIFNTTFIWICNDDVFALANLKLLSIVYKVYKRNSETIRSRYDRDVSDVLCNFLYKSTYRRKIPNFL